ncbi:ABC transporter permease [Actinoplanes sp. TFC3]|uniref:ABC transporter permease n=1 Tax=Actinoplanes sp. TFC3 TaxID=1710355 RepID=UPI0008351801|nr:ABC transporter permease [Actinoplanes sp. TFC3]
MSVIRTQLSGILRRPGRLLLTGLSVLVAAFVVFGTVLTHDVVTRVSLDSFSETPEAVSLVVSSQGNPISSRQVAEVQRLAGVAQTAGRETLSFKLGDSASGVDLDVLADPGSGPMSRITLATGSYPTAAKQIALDQRAAARLGAVPGSTLRLRTGNTTDKPIKVTVTAVVDGPRDSAERAYAPDRVVAGLSSEPGYPRVDILAEPGTDVDGLQDKISTQLMKPDTYLNITTGAITRRKEAIDEARQLDDLFALVAMFVAVAVVAAALVATSTFRIVFTQRLRQLALLRTIGAQRGQLVRALAVEGAVIGLVTGTTGVLLAQAAGFAAPAIAGAFGHPLPAPAMPVGAAIAVIIGSGLLTTGAVLAPAFTAAGVAPLQALRSASTSGSERGVSAARVLLGVLLTIAAAALGWLTADQMSQPNTSPDVLLYIVGIGALAFGVLIALGPVLIRPVLAVTGWPLRRSGPTGRLAVSGLGGTPRRAAAVAVVVALGVAMLAGTVVGISGLQKWTDQTLARQVPADLLMDADDPAAFAAVPDAVRADSRFTHVTPIRLGDIKTSRAMSYGVISLDLKALPTSAALESSSGSIAALGPGRAILSAQLAADYDVTAGDTVTLKPNEGKGAARVEVAAVLTDDAPLGMGAVLDTADLTMLTGRETGPDGVLADVASGSRDDAIAAFRKLGTPAEAEITVLADERDKRNGEISSLFLAALGLLGLTVLIAVVGVATTTSLSVLERTRESGLLRALGLSRTGLRSMIGIEAGLYGVIGAVLGIALGVPFAWLALEALNFDLPLTFPGGRLLLIVLAMAAITALAGLVPARRAARISPVAALAAD